MPRKQEPTDDPRDRRVRARAAVTIIDTMSGERQEDAELAAFMAIFHPDFPAEELLREQRMARRRS